MHRVIHEIEPRKTRQNKTGSLLQRCGRLCACLLLACSLAACQQTATIVAPTVELPTVYPTFTPAPPATVTPIPPDTPLPSLTPVATNTLEYSPTPTASDTPVATPTDASTPQGEFACPNAPRSRLQVGDSARVTYTNGLTLRVRQDPIFDKDNVLVQIKEGTQFQIIGGPVCAIITETGMSFVFWQIQVSSPRVIGWAAEGDSVNYYIEKWP